MARNKYDIDEKLEAEFNFQHLKRLLRYVKPYSREMAIALLLMIATSVASLLEPMLIMNAIDKKMAANDIKGLVFLALLCLAVIVARAFFLKKGIYKMANIGQSVIRDIRLDLFTHLQELPFSYYDSRPHGKILVRVVNYVNSLSNLLSNGIINLATDLLSLVFILIFMFVINVRLTLICLASIPFLFMVIFLIKNAQRKLWQEVSTSQSNLNAYVHESIEGIKVTQSFAREEENLGIFESLSGRYRTTWMAAIKVQTLLWPIVENISVIMVSIIYVVGVAGIGQSITVGVLVAFVGYMWRFWQPIANLGNFYNSIIVAMAYLERIFETLDEKVTVADLPGAEEMPPVTGRVEFRDVSFSYEPGVTVLDRVSFKAEPGDTIALVGPTGAGKTTIVNLLSRFYNVEDGAVFIDGTDISRVTLKSLRRQMGVMMQDTFLFSGTIMENIRYGRLDATDEEVIEAAKAVQAHSFIEKMEKGYFTEVNERGSRLSTGQKQLISFARALLADPRILILDEATSSIDTETELALQKGLAVLLKGRTSFVIAHRLSTIKSATRIMYVDNGRIMEQGSHDELIRARGLYWKLYTSQVSMMEAV
jgi:ATP-binding cassette subfamily B multidrug efflux pump